MSELSFNEGSNDLNKNPIGANKMANWLQSRGLVKNQKSAEVVLLVVVMFFFGLTIFAMNYYFSDDTKNTNNSNPQNSEIPDFLKNRQNNN